MKVYIVKCRSSSCDNEGEWVVTVFDSEEKARQYIETTCHDFTYNAEEKVWICEKTYVTNQMWYEEWEVE